MFLNRRVRIIAVLGLVLGLIAAGMGVVSAAVKTPAIQRWSTGSAPMSGFTREAFQQALADALGLTVEDLQTAQTSARTQMLETAVEAGTLTQEQADAILAGEYPDHGYYHGHPGRKGWAWAETAPAREAFQQALADALGLTVEDLQTAQTSARTQMLETAVEAGTLTREQADAILAGEHPDHKSRHSARRGHRGFFHHGLEGRE